MSERPSSYGEYGGSGQRGAENTKSAFSQAGDATESVRQNINAYADTMISGKSKTTPDNQYHTHAIQEHESTGIHPDAKKAGDELAKGAGAAAGKVEDFVERHKKH